MGILRLHHDRVVQLYAVALLGALLTVGSLSDHVGRRPVLVTAVAVQAAVMIVFASADGVGTLLFARIVQGLATGSALGAGMLDLYPGRGTLANAVAPPIGTAVGAVVSGLLVQYLPDPAQLVYLVLFAVLVQAVGLIAMPETSKPKSGALASLMPEVRLPRATRRPVLVAGPALVAVWSLGGLYASVGPAIVGQVVGSDSSVLGGLALFALTGSAAVSVVVVRNTPAWLAMVSGGIAMVIGVGITVVSVSTSSSTGFFIGSVLAGLGFGADFQGAVRTIVPLAKSHERAGVLSAVFLVSYLALGLPAVVAGVLVVHGYGLIATTRDYGLIVMALATVAVAGVGWAQRSATVLRVESSSAK